MEMQQEIQKNMQHQMATLFACFSGDGSFLSGAPFSTAHTNNVSFTIENILDIGS